LNGERGRFLGFRRVICTRRLAPGCRVSASARMAWARPSSRAAQVHRQRAADTARGNAAVGVAAAAAGLRPSQPAAARYTRYILRCGQRQDGRRHDLQAIRYSGQFRGGRHGRLHGLRPRSHGTSSRVPHRRRCSRLMSLTSTATGIRQASAAMKSASVTASPTGREYLAKPKPGRKQ